MYNLDLPNYNVNKKKNKVYAAITTFDGIRVSKVCQTIDETEQHIESDIQQVINDNESDFDDYTEEEFFGVFK